MKFKHLVSGLVMALSAVGAQATSFFDRPLTVIAHRGGADLWPEETMLAFGRAASLSSDLIFEMDVQMTADGVLVLMHDDTVNRTTNGMGAVSSLTYAQLSALDAGYRFTSDGGVSFPHRGTGLQVLKFDDVLAAFPDRRMLIEVKAEAGTAAVKPVIDAIRSHNMQSRVALSSFDERQVAIMRAEAPEIPTLYSEASATALVLGLLNGSFTPSLLVDDILDLPYNLITSGVVPASALSFIQKSLGVKVLVDTVNDLPTMQYFLDLPVDGIITDRPDLLIALTTPVPEPAAAWLMLAGAAGLFAYRRRSA